MHPVPLEGEYALELAKKLLDDSDSFASKVRDFDRRNRTITLGVCAPAPIWRLVPLISNLFPHMTLQTEMDDDRRLLTDLENNIYQLIATHTEPDSAKYFYKECGKESLMFALPKSHKYARRKSLSFAEMNGENMLLMPDIGFWDFVRTDKMPDSRFMTQNDRFSFQELVLASSLPSFTSDLAESIYTDSMINEIRELLLNARQRVATHINTELLSTYWNVGRIIVEHEQNSNERATYGKQQLRQISKELTKEFGKGFSVSNIQFMRRFYQAYQIQQTVSVKLSWSHYCELLSISDLDKRSFYEKEAVNSGWSNRELKRQISTSLYERLLLTEGKTNQETILSLAEKGIEMAQPIDMNEPLRRKQRGIIPAID